MFIAITSRSCNGPAVRIKLSKPWGKMVKNKNKNKKYIQHPSHPNGMFIARHLRHLFVAGIVKNTLTTVFSISRITFTVVKLSVYKEVRLKVLPQIQSRRQ